MNLPRLARRGALALLLLLPVFLPGQPPAPSPEHARTGAWMKRFYQTQDVGRFPGFWDEVAGGRLLEARNQVEPLKGFLSQVFHQHPDLIAGRLDQPAALPPGQRAAACQILWLSDTKEGWRILQEAGQSDLAEQPVPPIGVHPIVRGQDLDFCWGWYFATGDVHALDPIIATLDLGAYAGAMKRYPTSGKTAEDRQAAINDAIFGTALMSLAANAKDDPRIVQYVRDLVAGSTVPKARRVWLALALAKMTPGP